MFKRSCDVCKKEIEKEKSAILDIDIYDKDHFLLDSTRADLCEKCLNKLKKEILNNAI